MPEEQLTRIKTYTTTINSTITDANLLDYVAKEVCERVLIYLNADTLDESLERIVARIVSGIFNQTKTNQNSSEPDLAVSSMSDNGQSVSFSENLKNYLAVADDNELFSGFSKLLARYRRINVVS